MEKDLADKIVKAVLASGEKLDALGFLIRQIEDETEQKKNLRYVGT